MLITKIFCPCLKKKRARATATWWGMPNLYLRAKTRIFFPHQPLLATFYVPIFRVGRWALCALHDIYYFVRSTQLTHGSSHFLEANMWNWGRSHGTSQIGIAFAPHPSATCHDTYVSNAEAFSTLTLCMGTVHDIHRVIYIPSTAIHFF